MEDCFVICPLGSEKSDTRKKSDMLLKYVFKPVLDMHNYKAIRADQIPKVGLITSQIINLILESPLVIADLTDSNPNVFYELAIRHAIRKPYIQVITKGQKIPFDLSGIRTIVIDITDLNNVEKAKKIIDSQISEFKNGYLPDSPISVASSGKLMQNDKGFAEEIASRLSYFRPTFDSNYKRHANDLYESILRKLWSFNDYSLVSLEELTAKMDAILNKLDQIDKNK